MIFIAIHKSRNKTTALIDEINLLSKLCGFLMMNSIIAVEWLDQQ